jgi:hypothetical protein
VTTILFHSEKQHPGHTAKELGVTIN